MIRLEFINLIVRADRLRDRYPGGWECFLQDHGSDGALDDQHDGRLIRFGAMNDHAMAGILLRLQRSGLRLTRKVQGQVVHADIAFPAALGATQGGVPCPWLQVVEIDGVFQAGFTGHFDPKWMKHRIRILQGPELIEARLYAAELSGVASPGQIAARALTRQRLERLILEGGPEGRLTQAGGRQALLRADCRPFVLIENESQTAHRNITEIILAGWLDSQVAEALAGDLGSLTLLEIL